MDELYARPRASPLIPTAEPRSSKSYPVHVRPDTSESSSDGNPSALPPRDGERIELKESPRHGVMSVGQKDNHRSEIAEVFITGRNTWKISTNPRQSHSPKSGGRDDRPRSKTIRRTNPGSIFPRAGLPWLDGKAPSTDSSLRHGVLRTLPGRFESDDAFNNVRGSSSPSRSSSQERRVLKPIPSNDDPFDDAAYSLRSPFDDSKEDARHNAPAKLKRTISALEGLMDEAVQIATQAESIGRHDLAAEVLRNAGEVITKSSKPQQEHFSAVMDPLPISDRCGNSLDGYTSDSSSSSSRRESHRLSHVSKGKAAVKESYEMNPLGPTAKALDGNSKPSNATIARDWAHQKDMARPTHDSAKNPELERKGGMKSDRGPIRHKLTSRATTELSPHTKAQSAERRQDHPPVLPRTSSLHFRASRKGRAHERSNSQPAAAWGKEGVQRRTLVRSRSELGPRTRVLRDNQMHPIDSSMSGVTMQRNPHFSFRRNRSSGFSIPRYRHKPVARNWRTSRKRITATIACVNTAFVGYIIGVYAGEVPRIQYQLGDEQNITILGNVVLYIGLAISTLTFWPLPLLHGRKPYTLGAIAIALPLQFPQAIAISAPRSPDDPMFRVGLLLSRGISGFALGFANINFVTTLLDLFGASLQSQRPHQEFVLVNDPRRHGGGMGLWLGIWSWSFIGSMTLGFVTGAAIIGRLNPAWGFYLTIIVLAMVMLLNVVTPDTRRGMYHPSVAEYKDEHNKHNRVLARGEVKLHISADGPKYWYEEVLAGLWLSYKMLFQFGFLVLALYLAWIYAQIVLVIVLLGALLSRDYRFYPHAVGLGVCSVGIGAALAVPLAKASLFSRARSRGPRTDSMTVRARITWTSHLLRRIVFTTTLPFLGLGYTLASPGKTVPFILPCLFAAAIGFLSNLATAECLGLIMETYDTCDLQPGVNSRHRLQSMASSVRRRRTTYSSFPRVTAGIFISQAMAFLLAAAATGVGGVLTRGLGAQAATGVVAGILLFLTMLLTAVLWRFQEVQVIPRNPFGARKKSFESAGTRDESWRPVIIGNPSGKMRRMNVLEMGGLSRWTEIRRLNKLVKD